MGVTYSYGSLPAFFAARSTLSPCSSVPGQKSRLVAQQPMIPSQRIGRHRRVRMSDVKPIVRIVDRRRNVKRLVRQRAHAPSLQIKNAPEANGLQGRKVLNLTRCHPDSAAPRGRRPQQVLPNRSHRALAFAAIRCDVRCTTTARHVATIRSIPRRCNGRLRPKRTSPVSPTDHHHGAASSRTPGGSVQRTAPGPSSAAPPTPAFTIPGSLRTLRPSSAEDCLLLPVIAFACSQFLPNCSAPMLWCQCVGHWHAAPSGLHRSFRPIFRSGDR